MKDDTSPVSAAAALSPSDFKRLGVDEVGYIRRYKIKGRAAWVLHAADGRPLSVQETANAARLYAHEQALDIMPLH